MRRILLSAHAALAGAALRAGDNVEIQINEPEPAFQRYDIFEKAEHSGGGAYKMRCKRMDRDPSRAKVKAARKQRCKS